MLNTIDRLEKVRQQEEIIKYFDQEFVIGKYLTDYVFLDDELVEKVSKFGYPKSYVIQCLEDNEANHCTTTYYLLEHEGPMID